MNNRLKQSNTRYQQMVVFLILLMVILGIRLFIVTILQHDEWTAEASDQNTKTITTSAPRGNIYDRNGQALAVNKQVFTVNFNASALDTEEINDSALTLINTLIISIQIIFRLKLIKTEIFTIPINSRFTNGFRNRDLIPI